MNMMKIVELSIYHPTPQILHLILWT